MDNLNQLEGGEFKTIVVDLSRPETKYDYALYCRLCQVIEVHTCHNIMIELNTNSLDILKCWHPLWLWEK